MADFSNLNFDPFKTGTDPSATDFDPFQTDFSFGYMTPGYMTPAAELEVAGPPTLGILLIEMGALTAEQLDEVLKLQGEQGAPLAQVLLEGGFCTQDQVIAALKVRPKYG